MAWLEQSIEAGIPFCVSAGLQWAAPIKTKSVGCKLFYAKGNNTSFYKS